MSHSLTKIVLDTIFKIPAGFIEISSKQGKICLRFYAPKVANLLHMDNSISDPIVKIPVRELLFTKEFFDGEIVLSKDYNQRCPDNALSIVSCKNVSFSCGLSGSMKSSNTITERMNIKNASVVKFSDSLTSISLITSKKDTLLQWQYSIGTSGDVSGRIYVHRNNKMNRIVFTLDAGPSSKVSDNEREDISYFIRYDMIALSECIDTPATDVYVLNSFANVGVARTDNVDVIDVRELVKYVIGKNVRNVYRSVKESDITNGKENGE